MLMYFRAHWVYTLSLVSSSNILALSFIYNSGDGHICISSQDILPSSRTRNPNVSLTTSLPCQTEHSILTHPKWNLSYSPNFCLLINWPQESCTRPYVLPLAFHSSKLSSWTRNELSYYSPSFCLDHLCQCSSRTRHWLLI